MDDLLSFRQFSKKAADDVIDVSPVPRLPHDVLPNMRQDSEDVNRATGAGEVTEDFLSNLSRISQLTGFSDPIYAEAYVKVHGFDILLGRVLAQSQM